jgi:hypothetical protein
LPLSTQFVYIFSSEKFETSRRNMNNEFTMLEAINHNDLEMLRQFLTVLTMDQLRSLSSKLLVFRYEIDKELMKKAKEIGWNSG